MTGTFALYWRGAGHFFVWSFVLYHLVGLLFAGSKISFSRKTQFRAQKKSPQGLSQFMWSGWRESNPPVQLGKLAFYRWTTPAYSCIDNTILSALFPVLAKSYLGKRLVKSPATKRSCEEMNPHFFTAPFYFAFIWFRVQGSGFRVSESSLDSCFPFL